MGEAAPHKDSEHGRRDLQSLLMSGVKRTALIGDLILYAIFIDQKGQVEVSSMQGLAVSSMLVTGSKSYHRT